MGGTCEGNYGTFMQYSEMLRGTNEYVVVVARIAKLWSGVWVRVLL